MFVFRVQQLRITPTRLLQGPAVPSGQWGPGDSGAAAASWTGPRQVARANNNLAPLSERPH